ncbi:hypothetical protein D3C85_1193060 [compost metagenome]
MVAHPFPDRIHARVARAHATKLAHREFHQAVRFAIAARRQKGKYLKGQFGDWDLPDRFAIVEPMVDLHHSLIPDGQVALVRPNPQQAVVQDRIRVARGGCLGRDRKVLGDDRLPPCSRRFDTQQKVRCGIQDLIGQVHQVPDAIHRRPCADAEGGFRPGSGRQLECTATGRPLYCKDARISWARTPNLIR